MEDVEGPTEKLSNENSATQRRTDESAKEVSPQGVKSEAIREPSSNDEPRGKRLKLYNEVIDKGLEEFMHFASFDRFSSMFHQFYKMNRPRMENIHKQFVDELQRAIKDDIRRLNEEASLESKLNELDKLESAAENSPDPAWLAPFGVPEQDFSSFIIPFYQKQEAYLRHKLRKIKAENAALALKVQAGRERIAQAEHQISTAAAEWEASATEIKSLASSLCPADVFSV